jgi:hypothetical protein
LKIDSAAEAEKQKLAETREKLLEMTREMDEEINKRVASAGQLLDSILISSEIEEATAQNLKSITSIFIEVLGHRIEDARQKGELDKLEKLQKVASVIQQATAPPPELMFIQDLVDAPDEKAVTELLENNKDKLTPEFMSMLNNVLAQAEATGEADQESKDRLALIYRAVLNISMRTNLNQ